MFCPEFLNRGADLKRLPQHIGLYSSLRYINTTRLFLNDTSEKPLEFVFFPHIKKILFSVFAQFDSQREM